MRYLFILFILSCTQDTLHQICPNSCWAIEGISKESLLWSMQDLQDKKTELVGVGVCKEGIPTCDEDFNIITCDDEISPSPELCDGLDNNCDGNIDRANGNRSLRRLKHHPDFSCLRFGVCAQAIEQCIQKEWYCSYPSTYEIVETSCDGLDNDCDGVIDERLFEGEFCYDADWFTATNPPCHPGVQICRNGNKICVGQVLPIPEICDGIDNNCNGVSDDTNQYLDTKYDIVFNIDTSGSMCSTIAAVAGACSEYSNTFSGNPNFRFALVIMSNISGPRVIVDINFSDFSIVSNRLLSLGCNGSGSEASLDSMFYICDVSNNLLILDWILDSNKLILSFTDERPQSYELPVITVNDVAQACLFHDVLPFIWSINPLEFEGIAILSGAQHFPLINSWEPMFENMNSIINQLCTE